MHEPRSTRLSTGAFCLCLLLATDARAAVTSPGAMGVPAPGAPVPAAGSAPSASAPGTPVHGARKPERASSRKTSLDWLPDVRDRPRLLELHAARNAATHTLPSIDPKLLGRLRPQPPAAGDGARP